MPVRFPAYRMRDGVTPLSEDYFNPLLSDIDARIAQLEDLRADLQGVIDDLTAFGLQRIDVLIGPAAAELNAMLDELRSRRDELVAAIGNVGDLVTQAQLGAAIAQATAPASAIAITLDASGRIATLTETLPGGARSTTLTYDTAGRVASAVSVQGDLTRTETYAYDAQGRLSGITATETTA
jgi:YD repeat-containing protein